MFCVVVVVAERKVVEHAGYLEGRHVHSFEQLVEPGADSFVVDSIADQDKWVVGQVPSVLVVIGQVEAGLRIGMIRYC